jgi:arylsulfatase A-like enzyme
LGNVRVSNLLPILLLISLSGCSGEVKSHQANVVLVIIDTLRADKLSSYGYPADTSPALSRLADEGIQLDRVIAQSSWTLPSIGSLLTSRYPRSLGLYLEGIQQLGDEAEPLAEVLGQHGYTTFGITANPHLNSTFNFHQGFDTYVDSTVVFRKKRELVPEGKTYWKDAPLRSADSILEETLQFVAGVEPENPVYLQINLMEVHEYQAKPRRSLLKAPYHEMRFAGGAPRYLQLLRQVTDSLGKFFDTLRARPGWEDALFVITSDHGQGLNDHPVVEKSSGHGLMLYDSHVHVPLVMVQPGRLRPGGRIKRVTRLLDLAPTILELVGISTPPSMQGRSLVPLLDRTGKVDLPEYVMTETDFRATRKLAAYGKNWKFFHNRTPHPGLPEFELHDAEGTPNGEQTNRARERPKKVAHLRNFMKEWEERFERAPPSLRTSDFLEVEREQLQAIGYLE